MLKNWKIWQKLTAIAVVMGLMIPILLYLVLRERNREIAFSRQQAQGTVYLRDLLAVLPPLMAHRGLANILLSGDVRPRADLAAQEAKADQTIQAVAEADRQYGPALGSTAAFTEIQKDWAALKTSFLNLAPAASFEAHNRLIGKVLGLLEDVGDSSNIRLDPELADFYLGEISVLWSPRIVDAVGQLRGFGSGAITRGQVTAEERAEISALIHDIAFLTANERRAGEIAYRAEPEYREKLGGTLGEAAKDTDTLVQTARRRILDTPSPTIASQEFFDLGSRAVEAQVKATNTILKAFDDSLQEEIAGDVLARNLLFGLSILTIVLATLLVIYISALITRQVGGIDRMFSQIGIGDFGARAPAYSRDELGKMALGMNAMLDNTLSLMQSREERDRIQQSIIKLLDEISGLAEGDLTQEAEVTTEVTGSLADAFNYMNLQLRQIIRAVQDTTLSVSSASGEIQATTEHLAQSSEVQSQQIVDTSAAVDEIALSIQQVSENSAEAASVADLALASARRGAEAVHKSVDGMNSIRGQVQETAKRIKRLGESSQEIGEIVQLIGDIADRTSILALNASIQAAMAGEAGRGFAVVAEEVERLAIRSADATKNIGSLIKSVQSETNEAVRAMEETTREVVAGSSVANAAGQILVEIESVSRKLAELIGSISMASKQQARGSDSVAKAMGDISDTTQQTAAGTRQVAISVRNLAELADRLRDSVSTFRLPKKAA